MRVRASVHQGALSLCTGGWCTVQRGGEVGEGGGGEVGEVGVWGLLSERSL